MMDNAEKGQWFVIHTLSGQENRVKESMERQLQLEEEELPVYEVFIPTEKVSEVRQGRKMTTTRKFFPGYVLLRMDLYDLEDGSMNENIWYFVKNTQGVIGFVGGNDKPIALSESEVEDMVAQLSGKNEKAKPKIMFEIGENVRIKDGAFENFEGAIQEIDSERGKLKLMVSIFGRSTPVELEFWQVERQEA
ncbi:MAG: transcription termination/antitermination factor NusG [Victivallales bacterium]|nr:transcription termination/antitermination factor NusG [Victivallales bacterium]